MTIDGKKEILFLLLILTIGGLLRFSKCKYNDGVLTDSTKYIPTAYSLSHGNWAVKESKVGVGLRVDRLVSPFYPIVIAITNKFINNFVYSGQFVSFASSVLTILAVYILAYMVFDKNVAVLSSVLTAFSAPLVTFSARIMTESLFILLILFTLIIFFYKNRKPFFLFLSSIFLSIAVLTKSIAVIVFLVLTLYLIYELVKKSVSKVGFICFFAPTSIVLAGYHIIRTNTRQAHNLMRYEILPFLHTLKLYNHSAFTANKDPNFTILGYIKDYPIDYMSYFLNSYVNGLNFYISSLLFFVCVIVLVLSFSIKSCRHNGSKEAKIIFMSLLVLFPFMPSTMIVHKRFMARMMLPMIPLFLILASKGFVDIGNILKKFIDKKIMIGLLVFLVIISDILGRGYLYALEGTQSNLELKKKTWMAAGDWIIKNVDSVTIIDDGCDSHGMLRVYVLRDRVVVNDIGVLIQKIKDHRIQRSKYILLTCKDNIAKMRDFINNEGSDFVSMVKTFTVSDVSCLLLKLK